MEEDEHMPSREELINGVMISDQIDEKSKKIFKDTIEYIEKLIDQKKTFDLDLYKIYIRDIKGNELPDMEQFMRIIFLVSVCGYDVSGFRK